MAELKDKVFLKWDSVFRSKQTRPPAIPVNYARSYQARTNNPPSLW